jgi:hypothetical protein
MRKRREKFARYEALYPVRDFRFQEALSSAARNLPATKRSTTFGISAFGISGISGIS